MKRRTRSAAWPFFGVYCGPSGTDGDLLAWCRLCASQGFDTRHFMDKGSTRNAIKRLETIFRRSPPTPRGMLHGRAALSSCLNLAGGNRSKRVLDWSITRYLTTDARPHRLRSVPKSVMTHSPHTLTKDPYMDAFLRELSSYFPPAQKTLLHHLLELYS